MASENGTVMDVCAEWRDCLESADPSVWNDERIAGLVKTTKAQQLAYLARIEAAWKREKAEIEANALAVGGIVEAERNKPGNAAAMREVLVSIRALIDDEPDGTPMIDAMKATVDAALSSPARNCDVGTPEEQEARYKMTGEVYHTLTLKNSLAWAQMPYEAEEGGAE